MTFQSTTDVSKHCLSTLLKLFRHEGRESTFIPESYEIYERNVSEILYRDLPPSTSDGDGTMNFRRAHRFSLSFPSPFPLLSLVFLLRVNGSSRYFDPRFVYYCMPDFFNSGFVMLEYIFIYYIKSLLCDYPLSMGLSTCVRKGPFNMQLLN